MNNWHHWRELYELTALVWLSYRISRLEDRL